MEKLLDSLTGIYNEEYLKANYQRYIEKNPDSNFVMIDFDKFKLINDTFGHNIGDEYLKTFAKILDSNFKDSIVVRLHGDEFAILTKFSEEYIERIFELCNQKITLAVLEGKIPRVFGYSAGSTKAEHGINITKEKADFMMYYAKKNHQPYQKFSSLILAQKQQQDSFLSEIDSSLRQDTFSYATRELFDKNAVGQDMFQIYTKRKDGSSIFGEGRYDFLRRTSKLAQFDIYNIQRLLEGYDFEEHKMIVTIDYKSLIAMPDFLDYLVLLKAVSSLPFENIILSIDINALEPAQYQSVIDSIVNLSSLELAVRLDKFDNTIGDKLWEETDIDYIKISSAYWKNAMESPRIASSLKSKTEAYKDCGITPIFEFVEERDEFNFLKDFTPENTLFSGNYFSREKQMILKK